jgi:excisionase family DNA binding protein
VASVTPKNTLQVEMLSIEQFAERMGVGRTTVHGWIKSGSLRSGRHYFRIGGTVRFIWGTELFQKLLEDSLETDITPFPEEDDVQVASTNTMPAARNRATQINFDC